MLLRARDRRGARARRSVAPTDSGVGSRVGDGRDLLFVQIPRQRLLVGRQQCGRVGPGAPG
jgi:hypothetical protein